MSKARTLANFVSAGNPLADGAIAASEVTGLSTVATTGAYADLSGKPTLSTVAATGAYADLSGKPSLATVATTGAYADLSGKPTLPSGDIVGTTDSQTLTNKTLTTPTLTTPNITTGLTIAGSAGTSGQVLTSAGSGAAPTWASAPAPVPTFTASGTISAAGVAVALNSDGTVSTISGTATSFSLGTTANLPSNRNASYSAAVFDPVNNKVLVLINYSSYLMGYMGTVSGSTISFGSEYQIVTSGVGKISAAYDTTNNKFVVVYTLTGSLRCKALTVSGSVISIGAEKTLLGASGGYTAYNSIAYSSISGKFMIMGADDSNVYTAFSLVSISGTSVVEHSYEQNIADFSGHEIVCNPTTGVFIYGGRSITTPRGYVGCITVSGTTFQRTTLTDLGTCSGNINIGAFFVPFIYSGGFSGWKVGVAAVFGTSSSAGVTVFSGYEQNGKVNITGSAAYSNNYSFSAPRTIRAVANPAGSNMMVMWPDGNASSALALTFTIDPAGSVSVGPQQTIYTSQDSGSMPSLVYCSNTSNMVAVLQDNPLSNRVFVRTVIPDGYSTNALNFIGFTTGSAASGATVGVSTYASVNSNVSGLTVGSKYSLTYSGSLSTSLTGFPFAGTAYGTTKILVGV